MIKIIKNVEVYSPEFLGINDILIVNEKIIKVSKDIKLKGVEYEEIDCTGKKAVPGYIDQHVHITGGGGEGSFKTRVPEAPLSKFIESGITTVVGLLGTDGTTRSVENLLAKAKGLNEEGITAYILTGAYEYPSPTLTGNIRKDITFIKEVIGVKIAISDHRAVHIDESILENLAAEVRNGGMFSGKSGIVTLHMGDGKKNLDQVINVVNNTNIPIKHFIPTHVNRKKEVFESAIKFLKMGGVIDFTTSIPEDDYISSSKGVNVIKEMGLPLDRITFSSDGFGSWSDYDERGNLIKIGYSSLLSNHNEIKKLIINYKFSLSEAIQFLTINPAKELFIYPDKGAILEGSDADILLLDDDYDICDVFARGKLMMKNKKIIVKGTYEE